MGILSGLEKFGLGDIDESKLFENEKPASAEQKVKDNKQAEEEVISEADFLYDKTYTCPVCDFEFTSKTVRAGKLNTIGSDFDLRPRYQHVDVNKYDAVVCPYCGYGAMSKSVGGLTTRQIHAIQDKISANFVPQLDKNLDFYSYEEAIERDKIVLANAIVKQAKAGEKAFILLKIAWLYRGLTESLDLDVPANRVMKKVYEGQEKQYLKSAVEGFEVAKAQEQFPIAGMDETTLDYLLAAIYILLDNEKDAKVLLSQMISSTTVPKRIKDKARELKEFMAQRQS